MGNIMSGGEEQAFDDLQKMLEQAEDMEKRGLKVGVGMLAPEMKMGTSALQQALSGITGMGTPTEAVGRAESQFAQTPSQQFQTQQAIDAVNNAMQAMGISGSGAQQQALTQTVGDILGGQEQQYLGEVGKAGQAKLSDLLGIGRIGAGATGEAAGGVFKGAQSLADIISQIGAAEAGIDIAKGGTQAGLIGTLLSGIMPGFKGYGTGGWPGAFGGYFGTVLPGYTSKGKKIGGWPGGSGGY